jgi:hypothetical protein
MKMKRAFFLFSPIFIAMAAIAVAEEKSQTRQPAASSAVAEKKPSPSLTNPLSGTNLHVIGYLETRGRTITIKSGPEGTIYTVKTSDGKILCENVSAAQLRAQAPDLHDFIKTGIASDNHEKGDARVRPAKFDARILIHTSFR